MATRGKVSFEFKNHISPRYVEPLLVQLDYGRWYDSNELQELLRSNGIEVQGKEIINININTWARLGMGEVYSQGYGKQRRFQLTRFGKQIAGFYSTNQELFFEVLHFLFYSAWPRSEGINQSQFWVYHRLCDVLWIEAPRKMEAEQLTARLQSESRDIFPNHEPTFPTQSIRGIFPWLQTLTPPFLAKCSTKSELCSERRSYCTPQLFHLATDLLYTTEGLAYGTSLAMDDEKIAAICRVCLLDPGRFWEMASLTDMAMREFEVRQGQWGTSLALSGPPRWIELPVFAAAGEDTIDPDLEDEEEEA